MTQNKSDMPLCTHARSFICTESLPHHCTESLPNRRGKNISRIMMVSHSCDLDHMCSRSRLSECDGELDLAAFSSLMRSPSCLSECDGELDLAAFSSLMRSPSCLSECDGELDLDRFLDVCDELCRDSSVAINIVVITEHDTVHAIIATSNLDPILV